MNKIVESKNKNDERNSFVSFIIKINRLSGTYSEADQSMYYLRYKFVIKKYHVNINYIGRYYKCL